MKAQAIRYVLDQTVPENLQCPISYTLMRDPVTMPGDSKHVFERASADAWLKQQRTNPMTREQVPSGTLLGVPELKKQTANLLLQTARFHRAFGSPREAAARTIQAAWLKYMAGPAARKALMASLMADAKFAQAQATEAKTKLKGLGAVVQRSQEYAQQAQDFVRQLNQVPDPETSPVDWEALAALPLVSPGGCLPLGGGRQGQVPGTWATQLRDVIADPSADRLRRLRQAYQTQTRGNFANLLLAQDAAPLRAMLFPRGLQLLELCADWVPAGRYGSLVMPGNTSGGEFYVGEVNAAGEYHGVGLRRNALQMWYGQWKRGVFSGLGGERVLDISRTEGTFVNGEPDCCVSWLGNLSIRFKAVANVAWGIASSPDGNIVGILNNHSPGLRSRRPSTGAISLIDSHIDTRGTVLGQCSMKGQTYLGELSTSGLPHGPGEMSYPSGWRVAALWNQGKGQGVGLRTGPKGKSLYAFDDAGRATLRAATDTQ